MTREFHIFWISRFSWRVSEGLLYGRTILLFLICFHAIRGCEGMPAVGQYVSPESWEASWCLNIYLFSYQSATGLRAEWHGFSGDFWAQRPPDILVSRWFRSWCRSILISASWHPIVLPPLPWMGPLLERFLSSRAMKYAPRLRPLGAQPSYLQKQKEGFVNNFCLVSLHFKEELCSQRSGVLFLHTGFGLGVPWSLWRWHCALCGLEFFVLHFFGVLGHFDKFLLTSVRSNCLGFLCCRCPKLPCFTMEDWTSPCSSFRYFPQLLLPQLNAVSLNLPLGDQQIFMEVSGESKAWKTFVWGNKTLISNANKGGYPIIKLDLTWGDPVPHLTNLGILAWTFPYQL